jgi:hypothetical protein
MEGCGPHTSGSRYGPVAGSGENLIESFGLHKETIMGLNSCTPTDFTSLLSRIWKLLSKLHFLVRT